VLILDTYYDSTAGFRIGGCQRNLSTFTTIKRHITISVPIMKINIKKLESSIHRKHFKIGMKASLTNLVLSVGEECIFQGFIMAIFVYKKGSGKITN